LGNGKQCKKRRKIISIETATLNKVLKPFLCATTRGESNEKKFLNTYYIVDGERQKQHQISTFL
jgi:hypothetical protein